MAPPLHNFLMSALASSLLFAPFATLNASAEESQDSRTEWRLFVADHSQPIVRAINFEDGKELARYDLKGYAALTASATGQTVFATQSDADVVNIIKTGIILSDHGEHRISMWKRPPSCL